MRESKGMLGGNNPRPSSISQSIPSGYRVEDPTIPTQGNSLGDTVYWTMAAHWDPRVLQTSSVVSGKPVAANRFSVVAPGYDYLTLTYEYLYREMFKARPGRNEPDAQVIIDIVDNIVDIQRMLGIYLTALTMKQSRDPEMFQRARLLDLHNTFDEMMTMLRYLPLPRAVAQTVIKYTKIFDVASADMYQNVGQLYVGDYNAFTTLFRNVRQRTLAISWMRQLYPELGEIGDPGSQFGDTEFEAFTNMSIKTVSGNYSPWINCNSSNLEVKQLASGGVMQSTTVGGETAYCQTAFAIPGSGFGGLPSQRTHLPFLCRWNGISDAVVTRTKASQLYNNANPFNPAAVLDPALSANIGHEYNMASDDNGIAVIPYAGINVATGLYGDLDTMTAEDTRYRVTAGFGLSQLSYRLDGNIMDTIALMVKSD